jgi:hypothetical protein
MAARVLENEMKRGWIVLLAALFIALGAILWEFGRAIPLLIWIAMQPAGWGCDEGPVTDQSAPMRGATLSRNILRFAQRSDHLPITLSSCNFTATKKRRC